MSIIQIFRRKGWIINPDDNVVNDIINKLIENDGHCPTTIHKRIGHDQCPCSEYIQCNKCYCKLYIKENEND